MAKLKCSKCGQMAPIRSIMNDPATVACPKCGEQESKA